MTRNHLQPRGLARLTVLCLPVVATLVLPSVAIAASGGSTVRATVGGDGTVKSVKVYAPGGAASDFNGTLPLKLSISRTVSGSTSTYHYRVENTFSKQQTVTYTDTAGKSHTTSAELQLPLVAQLGIQLPSSFKDVSAPTGVVQTDPDGVNRVLFNLVLFSPLGAPTQDVTFTATGNGSPTAELAATAVNPASTAGLSQASQDANASGQQDDFWASFASGGNGGLTQLADGMGKLVAGLQQATPGAHQLADGIKAAGAGAIKLDDGTKSAYDGSKKLAAGAKSAHTGSGALATGIGQIHDGNVSLASGLGQISGGLGQLASPTAGLPSAVAGLQQIHGGLAQIIAGIGPTGSLTSPGLLDGLGAIDLGLKDSLTKLTALDAGLLCAGNTIIAVVSGGAAGFTPTGCTSPLPALTGIADPVAQAVLVGSPPPGTPGVALQLLGAEQLLHASLQAPTASNPSTLPAAIGGVEAVIHGLTHAATSTTDPGGVKEVLILLNGDTALNKVITGLQGAVTGVTALNAGATAADAGAQKLAAGSGDALTGAKQLDAGLGEIAVGLGSLSSGLGQLSAGQHQVATGLPAAVKGSGDLASGLDQLTAGAGQVHSGILAVQSGAVTPLLTQITQGSQNAKKQLAILDAAGALAASAPGGAGTAYVLSQSPNGFRLAASTTSSGGSNTGRNIGIGLGGLVALVIAVTAGFALGRRSSVSA